MQRAARPLLAAMALVVSGVAVIGGIAAIATTSQRGHHETALPRSSVAADPLDYSAQKRAVDPCNSARRLADGSCRGGAASATADRVETAALRRLISPHIEGDALIIEGEIDSHIYDYLQYEAAKVAAVKVIELNSLGGNQEWALAIAQKVKALGKPTLLASGRYCASACAYIFAAGRARLAAEDAWIGVHGARLGVGYVTNFQGLCFVDLPQGSAFAPRKPGCQAFLAHWSAVAMQSTSEAFDLMESNGVSPDLRKAYFEMPDDPQWAADLNVIRKPDWRLTATEARKYNLVTAVLPRTSY